MSAVASGERAAPHPPTLRAFFDAAPIDEARLQRALDKKLRGPAEIAGVGRAEALAQLTPEAHAALASALDIPLADAMARAWLQFAELRDAAQLSASGRPYVAPLGRHRLTSEHAPLLEISFGDVVLEELEARVALTIAVEAVEIILRGGAISALRNGFYSAAGALSLDGATLVALPSRAFAITQETPLRRPLRPPH